MRTGLSRGSTNTEPGAGRGPRAGSPRGVVVATGSNTQPGSVLLRFLRRSEFYVESMTRSLPLPVLYLSTPSKVFPYRFR
jgi:hypothetical protein